MHIQSFVFKERKGSICFKLTNQNIKIICIGVGKAIAQKDTLDKIASEGCNFFIDSFSEITELDILKESYKAPKINIGVEIESLVSVKDRVKLSFEVDNQSDSTIPKGTVVTFFDKNEHFRRRTFEITVN